MISDVTIRFCEAFDKLLAQGETTGQKDFASKVGMSTSMMTEIVKKRSNVGVTAIQNIVIIYNIDSLWLLTGKVSATVYGTDKNALEMIRDLSAENALLKKENDQLKRGDCRDARDAGYAAAG